MLLITTGGKQFQVSSSIMQAYTLMLCLFLVCVSSVGRAQDKEVMYSDQQWFQYFTQVKLDKNWTVLSDGGYRFKYGFEEPAQYIVRAGMGYNLNPDIRLAIRFAHLGVYSASKLNKLEYRWSQEFLTKQKYGDLALTHLIRVEERYFTNINDGNAQNEDSFNFRFRYKFVIDIPLMQLSQSNPDRKLLLSVGDEVFFNAGHEIVYNIFDQNRILLGPTIQLSNHFSIALTYNHQFRAFNAPNSYKQDDIFWMIIRQTIDINKKKTEKN